MIFEKRLVQRLIYAFPDKNQLTKFLTIEEFAIFDFYYRLNLLFNKSESIFIFKQLLKNRVFLLSEVNKKIFNFPEEFKTTQEVFYSPEINQLKSFLNDDELNAFCLFVKIKLIFDDFQLAFMIFRINKRPFNCFDSDKEIKSLIRSLIKYQEKFPDSFLSVDVVYKIIKLSEGV